MQGLTRGQTLEVSQEAMDLIVNRDVLLVGTDDILSLPPQCDIGGALIPQREIGSRGWGLKVDNSLGTMSL